MLIAGALAFGLEGFSRGSAARRRLADGALVLLAVAAAANNLKFLSFLVSLYRGTA